MYTIFIYLNLCNTCVCFAIPLKEFNFKLTWLFTTHKINYLNNYNNDENNA